MSDVIKQAMYKRDVISDNLRRLEREIEQLKCNLETQNRIIRAEDRKGTSDEA